jgi:hypothetical protein
MFSKKWFEVMMHGSATAYVTTYAPAGGEAATARKLSAIAYPSALTPTSLWRALQAI